MHFANPSSNVSTGLRDHRRRSPEQSRECSLGRWGARSGCSGNDWAVLKMANPAPCRLERRSSASHRTGGGSRHQRISAAPICRRGAEPPRPAAQTRADPWRGESAADVGPAMLYEPPRSNPFHPVGCDRPDRLPRSPATEAISSALEPWVATSTVLRWCQGGCCASENVIHEERERHAPAVRVLPELSPHVRERCRRRAQVRRFRHCWKARGPASDRTVRCRAAAGCRRAARIGAARAPSRRGADG